MGIPFNTPSNIPRIETHLRRFKDLSIILLLTPPPTYQGLKRSINSAKSCASSMLLTPPPTYQGLKPFEIYCPHMMTPLLTPPPTYQGLKQERLKDFYNSRWTFNTPSNIPRIETGSFGGEVVKSQAFNTPSNIPRIETIPTVVCRIDHSAFNTPSNIPRIETCVTGQIDYKPQKLLTPPPTYQGLKLPCSH